jgi:hypothetical protein
MQELYRVYADLDIRKATEEKKMYGDLLDLLKHNSNSMSEDIMMFSQQHSQQQPNSGLSGNGLHNSGSYYNG